VPKINRPFCLIDEFIMFSIATNMGTSAPKSRKVVYEVGGQAIQSNNPDIMASNKFFFMRYKETMCSA
jgi:hypothetical protein